MANPTAENKLYKLSWRNKATGVEGYEDFVEAVDLLDAIDQAKTRLEQDGMKRADIEITDAGIRHG